MSRSDWLFQQIESVFIWDCLNPKATYLPRNNFFCQANEITTATFLTLIHCTSLRSTLKKNASLSNDVFDVVIANFSSRAPH